MATVTVPLTTQERQALTTDIVSDVMGLGPVEKFLADPTVSEVMVNGLSPIYVERSGAHRARPTHGSCRRTTCDA